MLLSTAHSYVKVCLGGPTPADFEALLAERELLKKELSDARQQLEELRLKVSKVPLGVLCSTPAYTAGPVYTEVLVLGCLLTSAAKAHVICRC